VRVEVVWDVDMRIDGYQAIVDTLHGRIVGRCCRCSVRRDAENNCQC
jgi:hypothetical protein